MSSSGLQELGIRTSNTSAISRNAVQPVEPQNGGTAAWLKVLGCFFVFVNTWGTASSFGVYQAFYETNSLSSYSPSAISWIGTVQVFLLGFTGVFAGPLYDRGYVQSLLGAGCFLMVFGLFMLSLSTEYYQIVLSQGVCIGIGNGLTYVPAVSIVSNTFTTKRPMAIGLAASGSAFGSTILPIMFRQLIPIMGFGWVNRIFGFLALAISLLAIVFLRRDTRQAAPPSNTFFDVRAFKEPAYVLLCAGLFFVELGYWIPPFSLPPYAQFSLQTSANFASYLLAIMNAGGLAGRVLPALVAQIFGPAWVLVAGCLSLGVLVLSWLGIHNIPGITVWSVLVGFMSGIAVSLPNAVVPRLFPLKSVVGARTGMMWSFVAFAALIGSPIAGLLIDTKRNDYKPGEIFSGVSICLGAALLCGPAVYVTKDERKEQ
ncbi:MFS general substrate transporter [Rhizodiscina lignyota]|uniref:MFS general substrate transporter n=1 Tax=Rhizodiscina lignyota TaxID=1504668 RepID=A0A9P4IM41_9PEZI|nr:MFS general substrate transporter [Rhizodiscina lignyota]